MDDYAEILILLAGMWLGYMLNDIRRDLKEWKKDKDAINRMIGKDKDNK